MTAFEQSNRIQDYRNVIDNNFEDGFEKYFCLFEDDNVTEIDVKLKVGEVTPWLKEATLWMIGAYWSLS